MTINVIETIDMTDTIDLAVIHKSALAYDVAQALASLPKTPGEIVAHLIDLGVTGQPYHPGCCVVANYLKQVVDGLHSDKYLVTVAGHLARIFEPEHELDYGHPCIEFVLRPEVALVVSGFDLGVYPASLDAAGGGRRRIKIHDEQRAKADIFGVVSG